MKLEISIGLDDLTTAEMQFLLGQVAGELTEPLPQDEVERLIRDYKGRVLGRWTIRQD